MTIDMFKCPKCGSIVNEHDWTAVKIDESKPNDDEDNWEEAFECTDCNTFYSGEELNKLVEEYCKHDDCDIDKNYNPFADWEE